MNRKILLLPLILLACTKAAEMVSVYPETKKDDTSDDYFGTTVADPYRWLEDDMSDETAQWVKAQNDVTFSYLDQIDYKTNLKSRIKDLMNYERVSSPSKEGDYEYYYKNDGLQNHSVVYRTKDGGDPEVYLDPNTFSEDGTIGLRGLEFTEDGKISAHLITEGGSDWRKIIVMNAETKEIIGDTIIDVKFSGVDWNGSEGFYYSSYDKPKEGSELSAKTQYHKVYYHKMNTPQSEDQMIFGGQKQPSRYAGGFMADEGDYLLFYSAQTTSGNDLYIQKPGSDQIELITPDQKFDYGYITNEGETFYFRTNHNAPNYRLISMNINNPAPENWTDIIPETENVLSVSSAGKKFFARYMVDAKSQVKVFDYQGQLENDLELPGEGTASGFGGKTEDTFVYYTFGSFITPGSIYKYDIASQSSEFYIQPKVPFNPDDFEEKQVFYTSKDGTKVPMFLVYKKGIELNGKNPTWLYGYGGFNVSLTPRFSSSRIAWLENGGIFAQANLRGGGEYGKAWHLAGTQMNKQNVFDDFIAAGEYLISEKYTSSDYLAIMGGSNGGLLVGATMTQRPELAKVAIPAVGVLDMLRYHTFTAGAGWAYDYGTAEDSKEMFDYLHKYSPYHALKPGTAYPATLITTADHDDRVVPAHSFKFASRLQEYHDGDNPVLIRIQTNAGHGSVSTEQRIDLTADMYSFAWYNMDFVPRELTKM